MSLMKLIPTTLAVLAASTVVASARDQLQIAGSSTVLPYATIVAEAFGENTDFNTPVVESGGSGAGLKKFCEGVGDATIDIANSSRPIKDEERATCAANGVRDIMEVRIGYDGIVFASDIKGADFALTPSDVYQALAAEVVKDGALVPNTATKWSDVNPALPAQDILVFVPGTKHGTREVFETKVIEQGCKDSKAEDAIKALKADDADAAKKACTALRADNRAVDIDGDYTETLARIAADKTGVGVFGLAFYENNTDKLKVATIGGVTPSTATIASGEYPVSRPLFFYVKKQHIGAIQGLKEFTEFFVSDELAGPEGPLAAYGLVSDPELAATQTAVADEATIAQ